jgi:hypothetical protein
MLSRFHTGNAGPYSSKKVVSGGRVGPDGERNRLSLTSFVREGRALSELASLIRTFARRHKNIQFVSIASRRKCEEPRLSCPPRDKQTATSMTGALFLIGIELKISRAVTDWIFHVMVAILVSPGRHPWLCLAANQYL